MSFLFTRVWEHAGEVALGDVTPDFHERISVSRLAAVRISDGCSQLPKYEEVIIVVWVGDAALSYRVLKE
jgi:hypothetical protein